ncbi:hypothetical protein DACRYDRAFT_21905 [Dacryopinax primogenitus]|uniref:Uncharacterized protein n=1 Tax=Dacryopinax primogenitus (strain DJM 731) TaxID=1858805 RepID=M5G1Q9_DACPD|nr:uncharacterized protein DACRYDRAFT_21905 [Dacryopinax primogenitus]EJU02150.1 hypothetical protein DACRYDRAFT_21905 [Dacryopinax primogenitus]
MCHTHPTQRTSAAPLSLQPPVNTCWQEIDEKTVTIICCDSTECPGSPNYISKKLPMPER